MKNPYILAALYILSSIVGISLAFLWVFICFNYITNFTLGFFVCVGLPFLIMCYFNLVNIIKEGDVDRK